VKCGRLRRQRASDLLDVARLRTNVTLRRWPTQSPPRSPPASRSRALGSRLSPSSRPSSHARHVELRSAVDLQACRRAPASNLAQSSPTSTSSTSQAARMGNIPPPLQILLGVTTSPCTNGTRRPKTWEAAPIPSLAARRRHPRRPPHQPIKGPFPRTRLRPSCSTATSLAPAPSESTARTWQAEIFRSLG